MPHAEYDNGLTALRQLTVTATGDADRATTLAVHLIRCRGVLGRHADAVHRPGEVVALPGGRPGVARDIAEACCCSTSSAPRATRQATPRGSATRSCARSPTAGGAAPAAGLRPRTARERAGLPGGRRCAEGGPPG
ncbi:hypothetical protein [Streptomyces sp. NPDC002067]